MPATVGDDGLRWGDVDLPAPGEHGFEAGDAVWCYVRLEHLRLARNDGNGDRGGVAGRVTARTFEGDGYALTVEPDGGDSLAVWLPSTSSGSVPATGERTTVRLPADAMHLLPR